MHLVSPVPFSLLLAPLAPTVLAAAAVSRTPASCPDYSDYSRTPHEPRSGGPLNLPNMRPSAECRTFTSPAVEKVIGDMQVRLKDPDLAMLFSNAFSSTLDTTVKYFDAGKNLAFIITGDITAQWLRDTGNQFAHLYRLLPQDANLQALVKAVINTESRYIAAYPYCGAFQPPPESGLPPTKNDHATNVLVNPPVDNQTVFECKFELDSLSAFLKISRSYYQYTKDASFINDNWRAAMSQILAVLHNQSLGTWDDEWRLVSHYNWTGTSGSLEPPVVNGGNGAPRRANGLVACSHRPSDDITVFGYVTADNAMMAVELAHVADVLDAAGQQGDVAKVARSQAATLREAVLAHTVVGDVFAYETDGYGGAYMMDDANVPSLASLPYLGFLNRSEALYQRTKAAVFSRANPYFSGPAGPGGTGFQGIGGPHVGLAYAWPMSQISAIFGTDDDNEILMRLGLLVNYTSGLGLVHESVNIHNASDFSRSWFAWANSYFAEMVLDLAERKPALILKDGAASLAQVGQ